jgi:hypothetical protein
MLSYWPVVSVLAETKTSTDVEAFAETQAYAKTETARPAVFG